MSACGEKKVEETKGQQGTAEATPAADDDGSILSPPDGAPADTKPRALIDLYPPEFGIFPLSGLPAPGRSLNFGHDASGAKKFELVFLYAVAAVPNFDNATSLPNLATEEAQVKFMTDWAKEFAARPMYVQQLADMEAGFSLTADAAFLTKANVDLTKILANVPEFVKTTQKIKGNRFTTVAPGTTSIVPTIKGQAQQLTIPVQITSYTTAALTSGQTLYTANCASCHNNAANPDTYLLHASDSLAFATDAEIQNVIANGLYPNGVPVNGGMHRFATAIPNVADQAAIVAYLRSFPATFDKIEIILGGQTAPALRFK
jgi:mono/diheme cytochrome c family protein